MVPEPKGKDPKTLKGKDEPELSPRSRWGKWHQDIDSRTRQQDVVEERSTGLPNRNNKGPQGPQGPWFGRLRRQGPPTTAHNGREGHYGAKSQPGQEFRPGRPNLNPSQTSGSRTKLLRDLETRLPQCSKERGTIITARIWQ